MQFNKTKFTKLESKKSLFLQAGFVVALAIVLFAFEWKTPASLDDDWDNLGTFVIPPDDPVQITRRTEPKPLPKPKITQIKVVDDKKEVKDITVEDAGVSQTDLINTTFPEPPKEEPPVEVPDDNTPVRFPEKWPEYRGGYGEMQKFLADNINYPKMAIEAGIQGTVHVKFVVEENGSVSNVIVLRGIGGGCDEEAVRVVRMMPRWIPGKQMNKLVRVEYNIPVKFILKDN